MVCSSLSKESMKSQIIAWLESDLVIERVYYFMLGLRTM